MRDQSAIESLRRHSLLTPNKPFVIQDIAGKDAAVTYAEASIAVAAAAEILLESASEGDVVLLFVHQGWTGLAWFLGTMAAGAVPSFMPLPSVKQDPEHYWASHAALLDRIKPAAVVIEPAFAETFRSMLDPASAFTVILAVPPDTLPRADLEKIAGFVRPDMDSPALLQHSSGTTGLKKGVVLSHRAIARQAAAYGQSIEARPSDVIVSWLPVYHDMGLIACLMLPLMVGQTIVLLDPLEWVSRPASLFEAAYRHGGTLCWMPNFAFDHLARMVKPDPEQMALDGMRAFVSCSEVCHARTFERFLAAFAPLGVTPGMLRTCYAMAETTFAVTQTAPGSPAPTIAVDATRLREQGRVELATGAEAVRLLSSGKPIPGADVSVRDPEGATLPDGVVGEIWVRSTSLFSGYHKQPEATDGRFDGAYFRTRDRGFLHDGALYALGRLDDLLIVAGRNVHAAEIEAIVAGVPGLRPGRAVAFDVCNEARGTNDLVVIAERADPAAEAPLTGLIRQAVFAGIGFYPARVLLVDGGWLQKTTSGKVSRHANRDRYLAMAKAS